MHVFVCVIGFVSLLEYLPLIVIRKTPFSTAVASASATSLSVVIVMASPSPS